MNLTILFIFIIATTIITDILTYKKDQFLEMKNKKIKRIINNYLSICFTYLVFTLLFSLLFRYLLVPEEYFTCDNCIVTITNSIVGTIAIILQIFNIYNFYDNYIYTYRFFASHSRNYEKILILIIGVISVLLNEFLISNINLELLTYKETILNLLIGLVRYSAFFFMTLLIIKREVKRIFGRKKEIEEYY